jgi:hypothetical protein
MPDLAHPINEIPKPPLHSLLICCGHHDHWTGCAEGCPARAWMERWLTPPLGGMAAP